MPGVLGPAFYIRTPSALDFRPDFPYKHVVRYEFRWIEWNVGHIAGHGVTPEEAEYVVEHARRPYPTKEGDRFLVKGQAADGRWLQVAYVFDPADVVFVIHARPLTDREKRQSRRRTR